MRRVALLLAPLVLAGCGGEKGNPGAVTPDEARALNEAAEMLAPNSVSVNALAAENRLETP
ncbi:hypothetical protein [Sphingomonas sp. 3-13AW]|jgi:hypothetical protein|uniref:hypothetical protein n=1 Tax=Sphingomonas sp. 3-13AW TaxID=3050450 RepID=UPI003BB675CD